MANRYSGANRVLMIQTLSQHEPRTSEALVNFDFFGNQMPTHMTGLVGWRTRRMKSVATADTVFVC